MDWIKDNKFLAGFAGFTIVGTLALGYFLVTGWLSYSSAYQEYQDLADDNDRLASRAVYPSTGNLKMEESRVTEYISTSRNLLDQLIARQSGIEDIDTDRFPVLLKDAYDTLVKKAEASGFSLPEDFFFGMRTYKDGLPLEGAVDELGFQLSAINHLTNLLIDSGASGIDEYIEREPMKSESEEVDDEARDPRSRQGRGEKGKSVAKSWPAFKDGEIPYEPEEVLDTYRLKLLFTAEHDAMVEFLNQMANDKEYFYWLRSLRIENESKDGGSRDDDFRPVPVPRENGGENVDGAPVAEGGDPAESLLAVSDTPTVQFDDDGNPILGGDEGGAMIDARILFGAEKVRVLAEIDIVRFKEPENGGSDAPKPNQQEREDKAG